MTLRPALARLERGFKSWWAKAVEWCWERPQAAFARQTLLQWRSQKRRTREMLVEADTAVMAARLDTVDGDVQLSLQRPAFNDEIERLLKTPKRSPEEERRLFWLQRKVREIDDIVAMRGVSPATFGTRRLADFGAVGRRRFFAAPAALALGGVRPWMIWTGAVVLLLGALGIQTGRIDSLKADLREARADIAQAERNLASARTERDMLSERAQRADQQARDTAQNYEAERARRLRTDHELRRAQNAINAASTDAPNDYGFDSVRSDGTTEPGAPGAGGSAAAGNSR